MASVYEEWANRPVTRDHLGRFADAAYAHATRLAADAAVPGRSIAKMFREGARPEGFEHMAGRSSFLWSIPDRSKGIERTDEQQEELNLIDKAIEDYYDWIGLQRNGYSAVERRFRGDTVVYNLEGEAIRNEMDDARAPRAAQRGFTRVADLPESSHYWERAGNHPLARGIWVDPSNPGTKRQPRYLSDYGTLIGEETAREAGLRYEDTTRTKRYKDGRVDRITASYPENVIDHEIRRMGEKERKPGTFGGRGSIETDFTTGMKWDAPRDFRERLQTKGKRKRQRTWIERVNAQMQRGEA